MYRDSKITDRTALVAARHLDRRRWRRRAAASYLQQLVRSVLFTPLHPGTWPVAAMAGLI